MVSRNVSNTLQSVVEVDGCTSGLFLSKNCSLIDCTVLYFSEIK